jgi:hypothetical protein
MAANTTDQENNGSEVQPLSEDSASPRRWSHPGLFILAALIAVIGIFWRCA